MDDTVSGDSEVSTGDSDGDEGDDGSDMDEVLYQLLNPRRCSTVMYAFQAALVK